MYVVHLQMDNSLNWALSNIVSGQITSDALWKYGEVSLLKFNWLAGVHSRHQWETNSK